jgi:hypothetical protein
LSINKPSLQPHQDEGTVTVSPAEDSRTRSLKSSPDPQDRPSPQRRPWPVLPIRRFTSGRRGRDRGQNLDVSIPARLSSQHSPELLVTGDGPGGAAHHPKTALGRPPRRRRAVGGAGNVYNPAAGKRGRPCPRVQRGSRAGPSDGLPPRLSPPLAGTRACRVRALRPSSLSTGQAPLPPGHLRQGGQALLGAAVPRATSCGAGGGLRPSGLRSSAPSPRRKGRATARRHLRSRVTSSKFLPRPLQSQAFLSSPNHRRAPHAPPPVPPPTRPATPRAPTFPALAQLPAPLQSRARVATGLVAHCPIANAALQRTDAGA